MIHDDNDRRTDCPLGAITRRDHAVSWVDAAARPIGRSALILAGVKGSDLVPATRKPAPGSAGGLLSSDGRIGFYRSGIVWLTYVSQLATGLFESAMMACISGSAMMASCSFP